MKRRFERGYITIRKSVGDDIGAHLWRRGAIARVLIAAVVLSVAACSKITSPQTAQDQATPAESSSPARTALSFFPSLNILPPPATPAPADSAPAPASVPASSPPPTQTAAIKPHSALGAKEAAMKMYPQLAVRDSTFNKVFRDLYTEELQKHPELLTKADWPLTLAHRTAEMLAQPAVSLPPASPQPGDAPSEVAQAKPSRATPTPPTALDRGAYNQRRSPYSWWPWVHYY